MCLQQNLCLIGCNGRNRKNKNSKLTLYGVNFMQVIVDCMKTEDCYANHRIIGINEATASSMKQSLTRKHLKDDDDTTFILLFVFLRKHFCGFPPSVKLFSVACLAFF